MPAGRPREFDRAIIAQAFKAYIEGEEIPIVAEFAAKQGFGKHILYNFAEADEEFNNLLRDCITKKEAALERKGLKGEVALPMAIFSLKQLGWSDKQETTHKGDKDNPIAVADVGKTW